MSTSTKVLLQGVVITPCCHQKCLVIDCQQSKDCTLYYHFNVVYSLSCENINPENIFTSCFTSIQLMEFGRIGVVGLTVV